jgi:hypothetical protein
MEGDPDGPGEVYLPELREDQSAAGTVSSDPPGMGGTEPAGHDCLREVRPATAPDPAARLAVRQRQSAPLVEDLASWLRSERALLSKRAKVAKAIDYLLASDHWSNFTRFLEDGRVCLTNNCAERSLRGMALGRNYAHPAIMRSSPREEPTGVYATTISDTTNCA